MNMANCSHCRGSQDMVCIWHMYEEFEMNNKNVMSSSYFYPSLENATRQSKTAVAATQRMGPSRKPGQDCQEEQLPASVMR
jgi:hypothetical protein